MRRRALLHALAGLAAAPFAPCAAGGAASTTKCPILLRVSPLAGFQYHEGARLWPQLAIGQSLQLIRKSDNAYDRRAGRIDWRGQKLGYLPRYENTAVSQMLDRGETLAARVTKLGRDSNPWKLVEFKIWLV